MSQSPIAPRLLRGAIIGLDPKNPLASVVVFQYNPDTMTRRVEARASGGTEGADRTEALRLVGPPRESISVSIEVDAADREGPAASPFGVHPPLAALEMLLYPKSAMVVANWALASAGLLEVIAPEAPLTLFFWGPARVVPVRITSLNIVEEQFDPLLHPTRAKVDLTMNVLSYHDLGATSPGSALFLAHQIAKEVMATTNVVSGAADIAASIKLF